MRERQSTTPRGAALSLKPSDAIRDENPQRTTPRTTARDLVIDTLAESEAALRDELEAARAEAGTWRQIALEALGALHTATVARDADRDRWEAAS